MSEQVQNLINQWDKRPRRQLDFSLLTDSSVADLEWTNETLRALIKAMPVIAERFGLKPEAPIVIQLPPPTTKMAPGVIPSHGLPLTSPTTPPPAPDAGGPSSEGGKGRGKARSTHTPKGSRKKADNASSTGRKAGSAGKPASSTSTEPPKPAVAKPSAPSSTLPPAIAALQSDNPPPPKLEPIG